MRKFTSIKYGPILESTPQIPHYLQKSDVKGIDMDKAKKLIASWEFSKGNGHHRNIDFLRWYEKYIEFDPIHLKDVLHDSKEKWNGIPLFDIHEYFIDLIDEYDVEIYLCKGSISRDIFLAFEFGISGDSSQFKQNGKIYLYLIEKMKSFSEMMYKKINFYDHHIEENIKLKEFNSLSFFYFTTLEDL